jgi:NADH dehydrogenase
LRTLLTRVRGWYGEHPLHLLVLLACFALAGYVATRVAAIPAWPTIVIWFVGAVVAHDLVLFPIYALLDRSTAASLAMWRRRAHGRTAPRVAVLNYLRIPFLGVALTFALFLPGIIQQGAATYHSATGQTQQPFLARWLLLCAAMFAASAVVYVIRVYVSGAPVRAALAPVRAQLGRGERIHTFAAGPDHPVGAVASSHALYHTAENRPGAWLRTPWTDLVDLEWNAAAGELDVTVATEGNRTVHALRLDGPADLVRIAGEMVAANHSGDVLGTPDIPTGPRRVAWVGRVSAGAIAGLLGAVVVGALTEFHSMLPAGGGLALGLVGYGSQAVLVGMAIGVTVGQERFGPAVVVSAGVLLGGIGWLLFPLTVVPLLHGHAPTWDAAAAAAAYSDLIRDVLHGGLTGLLLSVAAVFGVIRSRAPRRSHPTRGTRVVIVGGGFAGISAAARFERHAVRGAPIDVTIVSDSNFLLFTPMLAEAAAGAIEARHISVPVRSAAAHTRFRYGTVERIDAQQRVVRLDSGSGNTGELRYDHLVLATGSVAHTLGLPGVDEHAWTLKDLTDATRLRDHVLELLERVEHEPDPDRRATALTFVVAGAGFAGTEMVAELFDLVHGVAHFYPGISQHDPRFVLVHAGDRILPELSPGLAGYAHGRLAARGIDCRLGLRVSEATGEGVRLSDGEWIATRTLVWTAGNRPSPLAGELAATVGVPALATDPTLRVVGLDRIWAAGDCARIPDPDGDGMSYPPTAQHAIREGKAVADNIVAAMTGRHLTPFRFRTIGVLVALGRHTAVGDIRGRRFAGLAAWLMWRGVYLAKLPGIDKRLRVLLDWLLDLMFSRDIVVTTRRVATPGPETTPVTSDIAARNQ